MLELWQLKLGSRSVREFTQGPRSLAVILCCDESSCHRMKTSKNKTAVWQLPNRSFKGVFNLPLAERFRTTDDFQNFLSNRCLTSFVIVQRQGLHQLTGVIAGVAHCGHASGQFASGRFL